MAGSAAAACFPVRSDVVSLGEAAARSYAQRSLDKSVADERQRLETTGAAVGRVVAKPLDCKHFPNLLGAHEWRCIGEAKICTKS
jgi:hypothetical protein